MSHNLNVAVNRSQQVKVRFNRYRAPNIDPLDV